MALNSKLLRNALGTRITAPATAQEAIEAFGGGAKGRSALAQEIAGTNDKKSTAYKNAMRNIQRYTTAKGKQRRTPKILTPKITRAVERHREKETAKSIKGPITVIWHDPILVISEPEGEREKPDIEVILDDDMLADFREALAAGNERGALNALADATMAQWEDGIISEAQIMGASDLVILQSGRRR